MPRLGDYGIILSKPWCESERAFIDLDKDRLIILRTGVSIKNTEAIEKDFKCYLISANVYTSLVRRCYRRKNSSTQTFTASIADITKALQQKEKTDLYTKLPEVYHQ